MTTTAGNRWDLLPEPVLDPLAIDVVVPYYNQPEILQLTLLGLARQSIEVMRQERYGPRRSHARNLGATRGEGEVLLFLDADMVPLPSVLMQHATWHRRTDRGATVSLRRHLDDALIGDADLRTAIHKRLLPDYRGYQKARFPAFVEGHLIRTDRFRSGADDIFYAMSEAASSSMPSAALTNALPAGAARTSNSDFGFSPAAPTSFRYPTHCVSTSVSEPARRRVRPSTNAPSSPRSSPTTRCEALVGRISQVPPARIQSHRCSSR